MALPKTRIKITTTDKIESYINCLVYGEAGVGKTYMCKTAPSPLILSAEGGMLTLKNHSVPVVEITDRSSLNDVYAWLQTSKEASKYKTICIDSLSEIAEVLLSEEKQEVKDPRQAYGVMSDLMTETIRGFRDLPLNSYFTAKTRKIVDELTGRISYMPSVPGQALLNSLPYFFDEVFVLQFGLTPKTKDKSKRTKFRFLKTTGDSQYIAKDRSGNLLEKEKPDLTYIFNKIKTGA